MKLAALFARNQHTATLDAMLNAQVLREWHEPVRLDLREGAAGYVRTSDQFGSVELARKSANGNWLAISGLPLDLQGSLKARLDECLTLPFESALGQLAQLDGAFAALYWDNSIRKLGIVTDILGMQPLHFCLRDGLFALATEVKAFTSARLIGTEMDPAGWGSFFSMGHMFAEQTLVRGVEHVPGGSILIYDPVSHTLHSRTYWQWPEPSNATRIEDIPAAQIVDAFLVELKAYHAHNGTATLCLSGGFDSRLILAGLDAIGVIPPTFSLSHADELFDMETRISGRLARAFDAPFVHRESDRSFFSSAAYLDYLTANEVVTPSLYLFIAQLQSTLGPSMRAIWDGAFPGYLKAPTNHSYLRKSGAAPDSLVWNAAGQVFQPDLVREMRDAFSKCLSDERSRYTDDDFGLSEFIVRNRIRHRIAINPLKIYSNDVLVFTPGNSKQFRALSGGIPYRLRTEHSLYQYIFDKFFPKAAKIPVVSGYTFYPLNAKYDLDKVFANLGRAAARRPKLAAALRLIGLKHDPNFWRPSKLVNDAVDQFDTDHSEISTAGVAKLKNARPPYDPVTAKAREILFYWSYWRRIMTGETRGALASGSISHEQTVG